MKWCWFFILFFPVSLLAQKDSIDAPYKRFPTLPPLQLLLGDSTTKYTKESLPKKKAILIMLFSPECSHCQHTAEELPKYKNDLKNVQIIMATMYGITPMNEFAKKYNLESLSNVVIGKDLYFLLPPFYNVHNLPYLAFYNKKGALISVFEGSLPLDKIVQVFKEAD